MTRFEKIKPMNIDEFVDYFMGMIYNEIKDCHSLADSCHQCVKNGLKKRLKRSWGD